MGFQSSIKYDINVLKTYTLNKVFARLYMRTARNTMSTKGTPECHLGLVTPQVRGPKGSTCG